VNLKTRIYIGLTILLMSFSFVAIKYSTLVSGINTFVLLALAFAFLVTRAFMWHQVLKTTELSVAHPFTALVQVLILIYSTVLFDEQIASNHIIGVFIMISGLILVAKSA
jgi:drug/metabolite transporter (DMT)-like permease